MGCGDGVEVMEIYCMFVYFCSWLCWMEEIIDLGLFVEVVVEKE